MPTKMCMFITTEIKGAICYRAYHNFHVQLAKRCNACSYSKKRPKIRNRYNQAPHLTQDTNGKMTTLQLDITNESQEVSSFPVDDHKASRTKA